MHQKMRITIGKVMVTAWKEFAGNRPFPRSRMGSTLAFYLANHVNPGMAAATRNMMAIGPQLLKDWSAHCMWAGLWTAWGCPTISPTPDILAKALLTDSSDVPAEEVKFPFPAFLLKTPGGLLTISGSVNTDVRYPCDYIDVASFSLTEVEIANEGNEKASLHAVRAIADSLAVRRDMGTLDKDLKKKVGELMDKAEAEETREGIYFSMDNDIANGDAANLYRWSYKEPGATVGDVFSEKTGVSKGALEFAGPDEESLAAGGMMVANLSLYILHGVATLREKTSRKMQRRARSKRKGKQMAKEYRLDSTVKLPKHLINAARDVAHGIVSPERYKVSHRFTVRGHWKMQPCGPGRKGRKRIFVEPYWKGPTTAEAIQRIYEVE